MDSRLAHPFTCIVSGPTGSGKSVFTLKLIEHAQEIISPPPERILCIYIFCYGEYQKIFYNYPEVEFHDGLPDVSSFDGKKRTLFVTDDLMTSTDDRVVYIFTIISHPETPFGSIFVPKSLLQKQTNSYVEFKFALHRPV